jgi:hypothetical protein
MESRLPRARHRGLKIWRGPVTGTLPSQIKINQEERRLKIHIKNQTDKKIDLCCGLDQELTLRPEREATVEVQDGDYIYIDQAI